jgi:hypothetical protein
MQAGEVIALGTPIMLRCDNHVLQYRLLLRSSESVADQKPDMLCGT